MRCLVFLSGVIQCDEPVRRMLPDTGCVICADGGLRHARRMGRRPDLLVGDLDSASPDDIAWAESLNVPIERYPADKDETDSELAIQAALARLAGNEGEHQIILAGALGNRPDHVLATQLLAARYAAAGWRFVLTDGISFLYTLSGPQTLTLSGLPSGVLFEPDQADQPGSAGSSCQPDRHMAVSAIPISARVSGLTYEGLAYPLDRASLELGSTRGVSNHIVRFPVIIRLDKGQLLIVITPE